MGNELSSSRRGTSRKGGTKSDMNSNLNPTPASTPASQDTPQDVSSKNKNKQAKANNNSAKPPTMENSAVTLGDAKINNRRDMRPNPVMITDTLSDVRVKYHINPKEI